MSVLKTLRERVAPELNHLYTNGPAEVEGALDFGWRSREHALHTYFVARLFGAEADLCRGDLAVMSRFMPPLTTIGSQTDHAWCRVGGVEPVDLSLTFLTYGQVPQLHAPVTGEGRNGDWQIEYAEDESALDKNVEQSRNDVLYIEKSVASDVETTLLDNPHAFLPPPKPEDKASPHAVHGPSIYAKISWHCFQCAAGRTKSVRQRLNREEALKWIAENYTDAEAQIRAGLSGD